MITFRLNSFSWTALARGWGWCLITSRYNCLPCIHEDDMYNIDHMFLCVHGLALGQLVSMLQALLTQIGHSVSMSIQFCNFPSLCYVGVCRHFTRHCWQSKPLQHSMQDSSTCLYTRVFVTKMYLDRPLCYMEFVNYICCVIVPLLAKDISGGRGLNYRETESLTRVKESVYFI